MFYHARRHYLNEWAGFITRAAHSGHLGGRPFGQAQGKPLQINRIQTIAGPRAGALELHAGVDAGRLLKALSADDAATLRQFVPWDFKGEPLVYMRGRYVRVEAGWPSELAEQTIRLRDIGQHPRDGGRWVAGKNEQGRTVTVGLSDATPHFLLAGQTGSGKSVGMLSAAVQLGKDSHNKLILLDGKYGADLSRVAHLATLAGPLVVDPETALGALAWAVQDMRRRYAQSARKDPSRLVILWDEPQTWLADSPALVEMTSRLLAQGRGANVHLLMATQHPVVSAFGDSTSKRNLTGRIALKVADFEASRVAVGGPHPRADHLLDAGDSYLVAPGAMHRAQLVYVDERDFEALPSGDPALREWPEYEAEALGRPLEPFPPEQTAEAIIAASEGAGRPTLEKRTGVGSTVGRKLLTYGRAVYDELVERGRALCEQEETVHLPLDELGTTQAQGDSWLVDPDTHTDPATEGLPAEV